MTDKEQQSMTENESSKLEQSSATKPVSKIRWKLGLIIFVIGSGLQTVAWFALADQRTYQTFSLYPLTGATCLGMFLWWTFLSGFRFKIRFAGVCVLALLLGLFISLFRFERFTGDTLPVYSFRFSTSSDEAAANYLEQNSNSSQTLTQQTFTVAPGDWPQFRGSNRDGSIPNFGLDSNWETNPPKQLWKHPVGKGWSSFCVVGSHVVTQEQRGTIEQPEESVVCYDLNTGEQIWVHHDAVWFSEALGSDGPRSTPAFFDSKIYSLGATGILNCLDASTGKSIWATNILDDAETKNIEWAMSAAPFVYEDYVICNPGGKQNKAVIKYDRHTGEIVWAAGNHAAGYSGAVLGTFDGLKQVVVFDGQGLGGYNEETGEELWYYDWTNDPKVNVALPVLFEDGSLFISSGYSSGSARLRPHKTESGDWGIEEVWVAKNKFRLKFQDAVLINNFAYGLDDGILACLDLEKGKRTWKKGRYGYGQTLRVDDFVLVLAESGEVALVEVTPKGMKEIASIPAIEGITWNHPAIAGNKLLVRNSQEIACFELPQLNKSGK